MNHNELIDRFCESRHRTLIVIGATLVAALVTVLPQVDQYLDLRAEQDEKAEQLVEAGQTAELLAGLRERVTATTAQREALESRTLRADAVPRWRNTLVNMVRESGCTVRRISLGAVRTRRWRENDWPLADPKDNTAGKDTPFALETRPVSLSVTGSIGEVRDLLARIESDGMLVHASGLEMRPTRQDGREVQMELELWCFALERARGSA
ncbi:MAG: hypothetical protein AAGJ46_10945 [Planctomycetota bacterium]